MTATPDRYPIRTAMQKFLPEYRKKQILSPQQAKAASCIAQCKTGKLGYNAEECTNPKCDFGPQIHAVSCNNRNCPCCQVPQEKKWVLSRNSELIEGIAYYHAVFTVPAQLYGLICANQKALYTLMFRCVSQTLLELCQDKRYLGAKPGIVAVLHTHGQKLNYHPHIHTMLSGGGLTKDGRFIEASHKGYLLPKAAMGRLFRGKFLDALQQLHEDGGLVLSGENGMFRNSYEWKSFINSLYETEWIPHINETFNGNGNALQYLGRYVFRTAISNSRIESVDDSGVTFRYKDYKDGSKQKVMHMSGDDFLHAFLMHVLPKGFCRVRFYGFLANSCRKANLLLIHKLRNTVYKGDPARDLPQPELLKMIYHRDFNLCPKCRSPTILHRCNAGMIPYGLRPAYLIDL